MPHVTFDAGWSAAGAVIGMLVGGCLDARRGGAVGAVDSGAVDSGAVDSGAVDSGAVDSGGTCVPAAASEGRVAFQPYDGNASYALLDDTTLYGTRVDPNGSAREVGAYALTDGTWTALGDDLTLYDARDGWALVGHGAPYARPDRLELRQVATGASHLLAEVDPAETYLAPGYFDLFDARMTEGGTAAWTEIRGQRAVVKRFDGSVRELWQGGGSTTAPVMRKGFVLWREWTGSTANLWLAEPGGKVEVIATTGYLRFTLSDDAAWWVDDVGHVRRRAHADGKEHVFPEVACGMLVGDAHGVVAVCGESEPGTYDGYIYQGRPFAFTGERAVALSDDAGPYVGGLARAGDLVAWVEYDSDVGCVNVDGTGTMRLARVVGDEVESRAVGTVGVGCWCCDAFWAPPDLGLSPRVLAWNYALPEQANGVVDPWGRGGDIGWQMFATKCDP